MHVTVIHGMLHSEVMLISYISISMQTEHCNTKVHLKHTDVYKQKKASIVLKYNV